ncbi:MAG: hypothetical protein Q8L72_02245 [Moraxellaceae bacterium]|nr:hypothetical protein [Moraxellaceae bacterium]
MKKLLTIVGFVISVLYLQGCASGATVAGMTSTKTIDSLKVRMADSITVAPAAGGKATNPLWTSQVGSKDFESALKDTLANNSVLAASNAKYVLYPSLVRLNQPLFGLDLMVRADVNYVLKNRASGQELMNQVITSSHTATASDSMVAVKRLRLANEGAIRKNIELLLHRLAELPLN